MLWEEGGGGGTSLSFKIFIEAVGPPCHSNFLSNRREKYGPQVARFVPRVLENASESNVRVVQS